MPARGHSRTKAQREEDLTHIQRYYVRGYTFRQIAQAISDNRDYSISYVTAHRDVQTILERWRQEMVKGVHEHQAAELARINAMEREAWDAWDASRQYRERTMSKRKTGHTPGEEAQVTKEKMLGDPRYLQIIQWCINKRCEILGLDAPDKVEVSGSLTLASLVRAAEDHGRGEGS